MSVNIPRSPPQNVELKSDRPASIIVIWQPPSVTDPFTGYVIRYTRDGSTDMMSVNVNNDVTTHTISELAPSVNYSVMVAAVNDNETGPFSNPVVCKSGNDLINLIICFGKRDQFIQVKQSNTLKQLYQMVYDKQNSTKIIFEDMRLSFDGEIIERTDETLKDHGLYERARVVGYLRLSGGATRYIQGRKVGINVKITNKEDIITLDDDIPTMELPCGHTITPESLASYIKDQVDSHKTKLTCYKCKMKWDLSKIKEMGLTTEEKETMEIGLTENLLYDKYKCKECPQCGLKIEKKDAGFRIICPLCNNFEFCWNCLRKWIAPGSGYNDCGNVNCNKEDILQVLKSCKTTTMAYTNISGVPEIRLCPACHEGIGHKSGCKHMTCHRCSHQFCFVCLKTWPCAGSSDDYNKQCTVAPRQTVVPSNC